MAEIGCQFDRDADTLHKAREIAHRIANVETDGAVLASLSDELLNLLTEPDISAPPCPRCGKPCHKVAVPMEPGDDSWVWGHDCDPLLS